VPTVKGEHEKKDRQEYEKMNGVRQGVHGNQYRWFKIGAPDEIPVIREEVTGRTQATAEPHPGQKPAENESGIVFDIQGDNLLKHQNQDRKLGQGKQEGPKDPEKRPFVAQQEIPPHKVTDEIDVIFYSLQQSASFSGKSTILLRLSQPGQVSKDSFFGLKV